MELLISIAIFFGIYHVKEKEELVSSCVEGAKITYILEPSPLKEVGDFLKLIFRFCRVSRKTTAISLINQLKFS